MDIYPSEDRITIGILDQCMIWFDLDLSSTPDKSWKYLEDAIRSVSYHPKYPLIASYSDDSIIHMFYATVYSDLIRNPVIVPMKISSVHEINVTKRKLGVLANICHPT